MLVVFFHLAQGRVLRSPFFILSTHQSCERCSAEEEGLTQGEIHGRLEMEAQVQHSGHYSCASSLATLLKKTGNLEKNKYEQWIADTLTFIQ